MFANLGCKEMPAIILCPCNRAMKGWESSYLNRSQEFTNASFVRRHYRYVIVGGDDAFC